MMGLIEGGAMKNKPHWMQIYEKFPPTIEPNMFRVKSTREIPEILYPEDRIRAMFYEKFRTMSVDLINKDKNYKSISQIFVERFEKYTKNNPQISEEEVFSKIEQEMNAEGILTKQGPKVQETIERSPTENAKPKVDLKNIFG